MSFETEANAAASANTNENRTINDDDGIGPRDIVAFIEGSYEPKTPLIAYFRNKTLTDVDAKKAIKEALEPLKDQEQIRGAAEEVAAALTEITDKIIECGITLKQLSNDKLTPKSLQSKADLTTPNDIKENETVKRAKETCAEIRLEYIKATKAQYKIVKEVEIQSLREKRVKAFIDGMLRITHSYSASWRETVLMMEEDVVNDEAAETESIDCLTAYALLAIMTVEPNFKKVVKYLEIDSESFRKALIDATNEHVKPLVEATEDPWWYPVGSIVAIEKPSKRGQTVIQKVTQVLAMLVGDISWINAENIRCHRMFQHATAMSKASLNSNKTEGITALVKKAISQAQEAGMGDQSFTCFLRILIKEERKAANKKVSFGKTSNKKVSFAKSPPPKKDKGGPKSRGSQPFRNDVDVTQHTTLNDESMKKLKKANKKLRQKAAKAAKKAEASKKAEDSGKETDGNGNGKKRKRKGYQQRQSQKQKSQKT